MPTPIEINTSSGWQTIDVYNPGTFGFEPIEIYTQNGWKVPYVTDPAEADTPIEVYTGSGWKGINTAGYREIDYFEDGDMAEYNLYKSGTATVVNTGLTSGSTWSLELDQQKQAFSLSGDGLPNYPAWNNTWEFYFKPTHFYNTPAFLRCDFMDLSGYSTDNCYRLEWESDPTSGSDFSLEKRSGGSNVISKATGDGVGVDTGVTYRCVVKMTWSTNEIVAEWWNHDTNTKLRTLTLTDSGHLTGPAIAWETNGYMRCEFDTARILP